jgi:hypothetical protein
MPGRHDNLLVCESFRTGVKTFAASPTGLLDMAPRPAVFIICAWHVACHRMVVGPAMSASTLSHGDECQQRTSYSCILVALAVIAIVLIWQDHRAHLLGVIPYLILLSCPLLHLHCDRIVANARVGEGGDSRAAMHGQLAGVAR